MPTTSTPSDIAVVGDRLVISGNLEGQRARVVADGIMFQCRRDGKSPLIIDLSGVEQIDLTGLRALVAVSRYASGQGVEVIFERPAPVVRDSLHRAQLRTSVTIRD